MKLITKSLSNTLPCGIILFMHYSASSNCHERIIKTTIKSNFNDFQKLLVLFKVLFWTRTSDVVVVCFWLCVMVKPEIQWHIKKYTLSVSYNLQHFNVTYWSIALPSGNVLQTNFISASARYYFNDQYDSNMMCVWPCIVIQCG